jgi:hypothetical protein
MHPLATDPPVARDHARRSRRLKERCRRRASLSPTGTISNSSKPFVIRLHSRTPARLATNMQSSIRSSSKVYLNSLSCYLHWKPLQGPPCSSMMPKSGYRFSETSCSNNNLKRDGDSKKSHHALAPISDIGRGPQHVQVVPDADVPLPSHHEADVACRTARWDMPKSLLRAAAQCRRRARSLKIVMACSCGCPAFRS